MANNIIKVTYKVNEDGSLEKISQKAKKVAGATNEAASASDNYSKAQKGVAGATSNSTKAFSKMRGAIGSGGLVGAYASLAANVFAITAAFGVLSRSSALNQLEQGLIAVGNAAGQNLPYVSKQLKILTDSAISTEQAMRSTALGISAGFSTKDLLDLTKVAKGASIALGRDMGDALDRLVRGTAKLEPEILDELGIMVKIEKATDDYAKKLNKTAAELTEFERKQAFLNATIEQGQKKFETVLNSVDPDPYQKLAAAFQDLTQETIKLINKGLLPLVKFLSESPMALFGAMTLFASSIIKLVIPSLNTMAQTQRAVAITASVDASKAAKVVSEQYTKAAGNVSAAFKTVPPSLRALEPAAKAGTLSLKEIDFMIKQLTTSEKLRVTKLLQGNALTKSAREAELAEVRLLLAATNELKAAEATRFTASAASASSKSKSRGAKRQAATYDVIDQSGAVGGFVAAFKGIGNQSKELDKVTGATHKLQAAGRLAAQSVGLLSRAFLNAIPVVGQVLFVFSLLAPFIGDLFQKSKLQKTVDEVTDSFSSFGTASAQLTEYLKGNRTEEERYQATLKVRVGIMDSIEAGILKVIEADKAQKEENIKTARGSVVAQEAQIEKLDKLIEGLSESGRAESAVAEVSARKIAALKELETRQNAYNNAVEESGLINKESVKQTLEDAKARILAGKETAKLGYEISQLDLIIQELGTSASTSPERLSEMMKSGKSADTLQKSILEAKGAFDTLEEASKKAFNASKGESGALYDNLTSVINVLNTAKTEMDKNKDVINPAFNEDLEDMAIRLKNFFKLPEDAKLEGVFEIAANKVKEYNKTIAQGGEKIKTLKLLSKQYGEVSSNNKFMKEEELATLASIIVEEKNILTAKENLFVLSTKALNLTEEELKALPEMLEFAERRKGLVVQEALAKEDGNLANIEDIKHQQIILGYMDRKEQAEKRILEIQNQQLRRTRELELAKLGAVIEIDEQAAILKKQEDEKIKQIEAQGKTALTRINLEFQLLDIQLLLEESKIKRLAEEEKWEEEKLNKALKPIEGARTAIGTAPAPATATTAAKEGTGLLGATIAAQEADTAGAVQAAKDETSLATAQSLLANDNMRIEALKKQAELLKAMGREDAARELRRNANMEQRTAIQKQLDAKKEDGTTLVLEKDSIARKKKELELQDLLIEKLSIEEEKRKALVDKATALGGPAQGAVVDTVTSMARDAETLKDPKVALDEKIGIVKSNISGLMEQVKLLGPEGELISAVTMGALSIGEAWTTASTAISNTSDRMEKGAAIAAAVGQTLSQVGSMLAASSNARIAGVDKEIAAEQKRDGKSKESLAKIAALEKKKDAMARKAFEQNKKVQMAVTIANTAAAIMTAVAAPPIGLGPAQGLPLAIMMGAMGALQLAVIAGTSYQGGGASAGGGVPTKIAVGERNNSVDLAKARSPSGELAYARGAQGTGTGMTDYTPSAFTGVKYRAAGGNTSFMVGEQGPEIFTPDRPGRITPADEVSAGSAPMNINFSINAIDTQGIEEVLISQRGNLIGMLREAANAHGENFMEKVNVNAYTSDIRAGHVVRGKMRTE